MFSFKNDVCNGKFLMHYDLLLINVFLNILFLDFYSSSNKHKIIETNTFIGFNSQAIWFLFFFNFKTEKEFLRNFLDQISKWVRKFQIFIPKIIFSDFFFCCVCLLCFLYNFSFLREFLQSEKFLFLASVREQE